MRKFKLTSLGSRLLFFFCTVILMAGLGQLFYILNTYNMQVKQSTASSHAVISRTESLFDQAVGRIRGACQTVVDDLNTQNYLNMQNSPSAFNMSERSMLRNMLVNNFEGIAKANKSIRDIVLVSRDGLITSSFGVFNYNLLALLKETEALEETKELVVLEETRNGVTVRRGIAYVLPVRYTAGAFGDKDRLLGTCIVWCRPDAFSEVILASSVTENSMVFLTDQDFKVTASKPRQDGLSFTDIVQPLLEQYEASRPGGSIQLLEENGEAYYVLVQSNAATGWNTINITPKREIYTDTVRLLSFGFGLAGITILITLVLGITIIRSITKPLHQIITTMHRIGLGSRRLRLNGELDNEFGEIGRSLNAMLDHIYDVSHKVFNMQTDLYEAELAQKDREMRMLQSQVNPHFLYNTFECIRSIASAKKIPEIVTLSACIADVFRYSTKGGIFTTVREELNCVRDYHKIINIRYAGRLKLTIEVEPELYSYRVLKLFLQPLVENAVNHSLEEIDSMVEVRICGWREAEGMVFTVYNSGIGIDLRQADELNRGMDKNAFHECYGNTGSIGLYNINLRLQLYYGDRYGLHIEGEPGVGTTVTVRMKYESLTSL